MSDNPFRHLPAVNDIVETGLVQELLQRHDHDLVVGVIRAELADCRRRVGRGEVLDGEITPDVLAASVARRLALELRPKMRPVINATGIVLHTNLGRAPVGEEAARAAYEASRGYLNLELDLETGTRSSRQSAIREWVCRLTGAHSPPAVKHNSPPPATPL